MIAVARQIFLWATQPLRGETVALQAKSSSKGSSETSPSGGASSSVCGSSACRETQKAGGKLPGCFFPLILRAGLKLRRSRRVSRRLSFASSANCIRSHLQKNPSNTESCSSESKDSLSTPCEHPWLLRRLEKPMTNHRGLVGNKNSSVSKAP